MFSSIGLDAKTFESFRKLLCIAGASSITIFVLNWNRALDSRWAISHYHYLVAQEDCFRNIVGYKKHGGTVNFQKRLELLLEL